MILPLQITGHDLELTDAIKANIQEHAEKLDKYYNHLISCRIRVEAIPKRSLYNVHIDMTVPGKELVVRREPNQDLYLAIRDAFDAARRELSDFARVQRGDVKNREGIPHARISNLFLDNGYGFLTTLDDGLNREIYFHENSVLNHKFKHLKIGMIVRFNEEMGEKGPQASTVTVVGS
ncbi:MAG: ribosome-associated translation inhibitor RaiA [Candidatus Jettenia sp.]|uniref:Cold-shock protein n=1 Tax=Candidatus Jettenia caeni TaxID=247490 RepID=I3IND3_9BACT|nr:ribosome-associated translation inhibitor RaiA [Candidatus Jettenia sp. AMX1]MBC6927948.1 ribosome-associated translation inhibitor RaiA [Candidatus Jettenia sp.]NUN23757.1 ribosome-associated translation inhibitor RaiA [Candidatus Jettenia caeni]KAA0248265.1 MAG: ribosome-associated translation inhibitor RaiA [Candidatus Jettenia sp. AMX1]MCE7879550.1 ribosome-associated translation inhibitor RaiA [Candidatus Jettenia sp. AMX1]MDL1937825.1 ribosome-associated translation inhibitor RaiA [Ca